MSGDEYIIVQSDQDVQFFTNTVQGEPGPPGTSGGNLLTARIFAPTNAVFNYAYDVDLYAASENVLILLPDATVQAGGQIRIKIVSFSASFYWQLLTTNGQMVDSYASGEISSQGLPSDQVLYSLVGVQANSLGNWNIIEGGIV